ncbi:MAG: neutral/alkaline non-lysosomal ceramidase N-terminal domain-containing protein [Limisphaerales bacterium]
MRKALRVVGWLVGSGIALILLVAVATVAPVDRGSFVGTSYAQATQARLDALAASRPSRGSGEFRAGFGRVVLTPTLGGIQDDPGAGRFRALPLAGYGNREGRPATGVLDDLWVKAVAWELGGWTGVVVSADALIIPREVAEMALDRLERERGLGRGQVYLGATHTHCGFGGWGEGVVAEIFAGGFVPGSRSWMAGQLVKAVESAVADLGPAAAGSGGFEAPEFTRNRLVGDQGRIDPRFSLLVVRKEDGQGAILGAYSAHATVLSGNVMEFSGDYPGAWQRAVETASGGMAMFLAGAVGSHAPKPPKGGMAGAQAMGSSLGELTLKAVAAIALTNRPAWEMRSLDVDLPPLQLRLTDGWRLREWAARRLLPVHSATWIQVLRLGDAVWLSTPCDYSGEMAMDLADATRGLGVSAVVTSFNGDYVGYVVPSRYYGMNTYETRTMSFFGPQLPDYFDALLNGLVRGLVRVNEQPPGASVIQ